VVWEALLVIWGLQDVVLGPVLTVYQARGPLTVREGVVQQGVEGVSLGVQEVLVVALDLPLVVLVMWDVVLGLQGAVPGQFGLVALGSSTVTWRSARVALGAKQGVVERGGCRGVREAVPVVAGDDGAGRQVPSST
jgi:hypothetical protein